MHGEFEMHIAPLVINSENASIATQSSDRKSDQSYLFGMKSLVQSIFSGFLGFFNNSKSLNRMIVSCSSGQITLRATSLVVIFFGFQSAGIESSINLFSLVS